jgi:hypothetical protein
MHWLLVLGCAIVESMPSGHVASGPVGRLAGTVHTSEVYANIELRSLDRDERFTTYAQDGKFEIQGMRPGRYRVRAIDRDGHRGRDVDVRVRAHRVAHVSLAFPAGVTVAVHRGARACKAIWIYAQVWEADLGRAACDGADLTLGGIQPGHYDLCVDNACRPLDVGADGARVDVSAAADSR